MFTNFHPWSGQISCGSETGFRGCHAIGDGNSVSIQCVAINTAPYTTLSAQLRTLLCVLFRTLLSVQFRTVLSLQFNIVLSAQSRALCYQYRSVYCVTCIVPFSFITAGQYCVISIVPCTVISIDGYTVLPAQFRTVFSLQFRALRYQCHCLNCVISIVPCTVLSVQFCIFLSIQFRALCYRYSSVHSYQYSSAHCVISIVLYILINTVPYTVLAAHNRTLRCQSLFYTINEEPLLDTNQ